MRLFAEIGCIEASDRRCMAGLGEHCDNDIEDGCAKHEDREHERTVDKASDAGLHA
jgi:hypothetical protein